MSRNRISQISNVFVIPIVLMVCNLSLSSSTLAIESLVLRGKTDTAKITISVDPRVELIAIVFRLAGNPEFDHGTLRSYEKAV